MLSAFRKVEKWIHFLSRGMSFLGLFAVLLMTFMTSLDVIGRYVFNRPIPGSVDMLEVMLVLMVYASFAFCASEKGNVRVDVLYDRFPKRIQASVDILNSVLSVLIAGLIAWQLGIRALDIVLNPPGPATGYFEWPLLPFIIFAAVGCWLLCLELLIWFSHSIYMAIIAKDLNEDSSLIKEESLNVGML